MTKVELLPTLDCEAGYGPEYPDRQKFGNVLARESNTRPSVCKADAQTTRPPATSPVLYWGICCAGVDLCCPS